jgi:hypothetical protein
VFAVVAVVAGVGYYFARGDSADSPPSGGSGSCVTIPSPTDVYRPSGGLLSASLHGAGTVKYKADIIKAIDFWNDVVSVDLQPITFNHGVNTKDLTDGA